MKKAVSSTLIVLAVAIAYFSAWPVAIEPLSWEAPRDRGLVDPFAANNYLRHVRTIDIGTYQGPEDLVLGPDGRLYATTREGKIIRLRPDAGPHSVVAQHSG